MRRKNLKVGVVAPGCRTPNETAERVTALAARLFGADAPEIRFHPQCFLTSGHFAGDDAARAAAFLETAHDETVDVVWIGRGGYGSCRILERVMPALGETARSKLYMGYSDAGSLLGALYGAGFEHVAHGPMPQDVVRDGGEAAIERALAWMVRRDRSALEPSLSDERPAAAFNLTILSHLLGTPYQPRLDGHVLMLEEVSEHMYRIDRAMFHVASNPQIRAVAGIRLGRCSQIPDNDPQFERTEEEVVRDWCARSGIAYLGRADIGHDVDNKVVPFGRAWSVSS
jgi:muramoyltetrapeptide carboxypeptidase